MRLPKLVHNWVSYAGALIAGIALMLFVFLVILDAFTGGTQAPYAGVVMFIIVPAVLLFGLLVIPIGMLRERRYQRRTGFASMAEYPVINLNEPSQRNAIFVFVVGSVLLLFVSAFSSYQAYEATESVTFCGALCHTVMQPEYVTYQNSPHARVACVECHVGPGATWYVRSKLSGLYQVYAVTFDTYPRPIPAPIASLRPAQQTCEHCHWPEHFFGGHAKRFPHFLPDDANTPWDILLLIRTGGGGPAALEKNGIHWHMNLSNRMEYFATDPERQQIPWVRSTNLLTGKVTEYASTESPPTPEQKAAATIRQMDCMDCHNRPSHNSRSPSYSLNLALATGRIDPTLPAIKKTGVDLLAAHYASTPEALNAIETGVKSFYRDEHPEVSGVQAEAIERAVAEIQSTFRNNFFPDMQVRWDSYADNIGHMTSGGCFRCHDGLHQSADGRVITKECDVCHAILAQGPPDKLAKATDLKGLTFEHPVDIGDAWREMKCSECHHGAAP